MSNTPPATDRVPHQPLEASVLQERADTKERIDSEEQASKVELIPSLEPCLPSASYSFSLVSVLLRLPHCPPYSFITVHCSATPPQQDVDVAEIRRWHKKRGWRDVGYHFVIRRNGGVQLGRPLSQTGAHVKGHNKGNIGICMVGGCNAELQPEDNFTLAQRKALFGLMAALQEQFLISDENVKGHKDWGVNKACPVVRLRA
ncbi:N-acetylmuramoyl-L-alanine amidase [Vibrio splendidus]|uniref:N-acetylmuramoyl-L-alanine amidase n=1 Tax=Vibrio splendidus TaxID=29497 RepID=UPI000D3AC6CB|nr:N-acetylmuramoyl-L-alanine amidase [Vibrio splendidus]PTP03428.1 N-acetylmuramoyl-L-alanine amidase [Vibrio splendidus]